MMTTDTNEAAPTTAPAEKVHDAPKQVTAYKGYAIYADYDANAPDSEDLIFVSTSELSRALQASKKWDGLSEADLLKAFRELT